MKKAMGAKLVMKKKLDYELNSTTDIQDAPAIYSKNVAANKVPR